MLETGFIIPRNKMLIFDSECLGKVSFVSWNGTKRNSAKNEFFTKMFFISWQNWASIYFTQFRRNYKKH